MGIYRGPNTVRDGLTFGYDTGYSVADNNTATRFYKGMPTVNLLSNTVDFNNWTTARNSGSYPTITANTSNNPLGNNYAGMADTVYIPEDGTYPRIQQYFTPSSTSTHTFSVWIRSLSGDCNCFLGAFRNSPWSLPGHTVGSITGEWQRFTFSWTPVDTTTHVMYMGSHDSAAQKGNTLEFWGAQMEENSVSTPYTPGSRSSTQSLVDLNTTANIDVSNVSFDSTGQPTFDGTDDTITFNPGTFPTSWQQPFSVEAVVYIPSGATWYNQGSGTGIIGRGSYTGSWGLLRGSTDNSVYFYIRTGSNTFNPGGTIGRDKFYHIVGTWDGTSQAIFYINGSQNSQETSTSVGTTVDNTGDIKVGGNVAFGGNNGGYGEGTFPVVKLYSKKLTATEIQQNYNAYKNRFNI